MPPSRSHILVGTYKIGQMDMTLGVEKDIVWLDVSVNDILAVNIAQSTA